jgi:8-oxo-dGTP pyrophosphatase MutT (NUDIX family)
VIPVDQPRTVEITRRERVYTGNIWGIERDEFQLGEQRLVRDFLNHMGAVAVVALDAQNQVLVITQYRHAVGQQMVELPAGLLDQPGEDAQAAAARELLEETGFAAAKWHCLVDICTTPGSSSEALRVFLAQEVREVGINHDGRDGEELEIETHWVPLPAAVDAILAGQWQNPTVVAGVLALAAQDNRGLRPADADWPLRSFEIASGRVFSRD